MENSEEDSQLDKSDKEDFQENVESQLLDHLVGFVPCPMFEVSTPSSVPEMPFGEPTPEGKLGLLLFGALSYKLSFGRSCIFLSNNDFKF